MVETAKNEDLVGYNPNDKQKESSAYLSLHRWYTAIPVITNPVDNNKKLRSFLLKLAMETHNKVDSSLSIDAHFSRGFSSSRTPPAI